MSVRLTTAVLKPNRKTSDEFYASSNSSSIPYAQVGFRVLTWPDGAQVRLECAFLHWDDEGYLDTSLKEGDKWLLGDIVWSRSDEFVHVPRLVNMYDHLKYRFVSNKTGVTIHALGDRVYWARDE